jgi:hypothetical protein
VALTTEKHEALERAAEQAVHGTKALMDPIARFYQMADERTIGEDVPASDDGTLWIRVFPVKYEHLEPFLDTIQVMLADLLGRATDAEKGAITQESFIRALGPSIATMLKQGSDMVSSSCVAWQVPEAIDKDKHYEAAKVMNQWYAGGERFGKPDLRKLPVHVQALCIGAWIRQSFIGERARPLVRMVEDLLSRSIGKEVKIATVWRQYWSSKATASQKSTDAGATDGLTTDGASQNGGSELVPGLSFSDLSSASQDLPQP